MKRGFISFTLLLQVLLAVVIFTAVATTYYYAKKEQLMQGFAQEANAFIKSETNNIEDYCKDKDLNNYTYYKDFNYKQKVKFILTCKNLRTVDTNETYKILFTLKGCREKGFAITNTYPVCIITSGVKDVKWEQKTR